MDGSWIIRRWRKSGEWLLNGYVRARSQVRSLSATAFAAQQIYKWLNTTKGRGRGLSALRSRKGTGRPRKLTAAQRTASFSLDQRQGSASQYGFDFGLWTRQIVAELVADKLGVGLSLASVGKLLAELGLTPQKPLMRAYERDPGAINAWSATPIRALRHGPNAWERDLFLG